MRHPKIIQLTDYQQLADSNLIVSVEEIDADTAARWLRANRLNRPLRRGHVAFLAREIEQGLWQLNGQPIVISDTEDVLDGQHRLHAVIESGGIIRTMVVYGISKEAFKTIDTGAARSGADALSVWFPGRLIGVTKSVGTAVVWCNSLEQGHIRTKEKMANAEVIEYAQQHPSIWKCAETVHGYPKEPRLLSLGISTALYEMFQRRNEAKADRFIRDISVGEMINVGSPEFVLRSLLAKDMKRFAKYTASAKIRMAIKAWNLRVRGTEEVNTGQISVNPSDSDKIVIF